MATFSSARHSLGVCDVCGFRFKLLELKPLIVKTRVTNILACPQCWVPDQPQLQVGMYRVVDPQAVRDPRVDTREDVTDNPLFTGFTSNGWPVYTTSVNVTGVEGVGAVGTATVTTT